MLLTPISNILVPHMQPQWPRARTSAGPAYLVSEDCEGTGTPSGWTNSGTVDWDYATSPAPLIGAQSIATSSAFANATYNLGADYSDLWFFFHIHPVTGVNGACIVLLNAANASIAEIRFSTDRVRGDHGTANGSSLGAANGATSVLWGRYVAGTGSNGILALYVNKSSTSETRPAATINITTGTSTTGVRSFRLGSPNTTSPYIYDKIRVSASEIFSNPA